ncbi:MAG: ATP-binding protein [Nitrosomonadales bacterium]
MKKYGIRTYVAWLMLLPMLIMVIGLEAYFLHERYTGLDQELLTRGQLIARQLAASSEYGVFANNRIFLTSIAENTLQQPDATTVLVLNAQNDILARSGPHVDTAANPRLLRVNRDHPVDDDGKSLMLYQPITSTQVLFDEMDASPVVQQVGAVIIEMSWEATRKLKSGLLGVTLWVTGAFLLLALFLVQLASRRIIEPVTQLSAAIQAIGSGYLNTRVGVSDRIQELNTLATGVNNMTVDLQRHYEHLEEMVRQRTADLQQSELVTRHALGALQRQKDVIDKHAIVTICSVDGLITYCNDKFAEVSGYTSDELIGQDHRMMNSAHHPKGFFKGMYEVINRGEVWHAEVCNRAHDGHAIWFDTTVAAFMGDDGTPREYMAVRTDITEQKRIEEAAHAASRAKSEFLANMSHEIRTPMNGVLGMVDILQQTELNAMQHRLLGTIHNSSQALLNILNDILDYSKIEAGRLDIECISTCPRVVAEEVVQLMISQAKSVSLCVFVSPDLPLWMASDPCRLRQILLNLLGNAIKFTSGIQGRAGQVSLNVLPCERADGHAGIRFEITDNGIGITPEVIDTLFQPFAQADASTARKFGGSGLGLSISGRLAWLMGGEIKLLSRIGAGSVFTLELPLNAAPSGEVDTLTLSGLNVLAVLRDDWSVQHVPAYCRAAGATVTVSGELTDGAIDADSIVLLGLGVELPDLPKALRVVRLVLRDQVSEVSGYELAVPIAPMLYQDLISGLALAAGRLTHADVACAPDRRHAPRISVPERDEAAGAGSLILLADDNETNREVMLEQLRLLGYAAEVAVDGVEALAMWRSGRYGMLLTDCHMPNMDGFALTRAIRDAEAVGVHLPIIAVTANAMQGEAQHCLSEGMDDYLSKPLRLDELGRMLAKWLKRPSDVLPSPAGETLQQVIWDPLMLTRMVGDQPQMHRRYLDKFLLSAEKHLLQINIAVAAANTSIVADVAHQLKSSSRTVGAMRLGDVCQELELVGRAGDQAACQVLADHLSRACFDAAQKIRNSFIEAH